MNQQIVDGISRVVKQATGEDFHAKNFKPCHGGCIHQAGIYSDGQSHYFVKTNSPDAALMFASEALGLQVLQQAWSLRVPAVIGHGVVGSHALLVLEAIGLGSRPDAKAWRQLGEGLASLHRSSADQFGYEADNFIGRTPQSNRRNQSWADFFVQERLRPQFKLAEANGIPFADVESFLSRVEDLLEGHSPSPSLLHGDLWSGNASFTPEGEPVIFDPACYYGDRETDLAFTEFFGGFAAEFYEAYRQAWPLDDGYEQRRELYNLYHVLNHANLFGGGYASQARSMMDSLIG